LTPTTSDWLLWGLSHSTKVRVVVSHFRPGDPEAFYKTLEESRYTNASVVAFSDPEHIHPRTLKLLDRLQKEGKRIVYLGNREDLPQFDRVQSNIRGGSYALTRHLLESGHQCLLRIHPNVNHWYEAQKQAGFQAAINDWNRDQGTTVIGLTRSLAEISGSSQDIREIDWDASLLKEVLKLNPVTAILAPSDTAVLYLRQAAHYLDREDLVITGYDHTWHELDTPGQHDAFIRKHRDAVRFDEPPVSVAIDTSKLGSELAQLAIRRALGELPEVAQTILCDQELVVPVEG
jgi:DNA-binding LacI/PurR family transcriptional regulator